MSEAPNREELITEFIDVSGLARERAIFFLESANWTLELALASFFESVDEEAERLDENVVQLVDDDDDDGAAVGNQTASPPSGAASNTGDKHKLTPFPSEQRPRIATLTNINQTSDDSRDEDEGQAFYAGGSEHSGQQVLGPPRKNPIKEYVSEVFRFARESGADVIEPSDLPERSSGSTPRSAHFVGTGYRLGQTQSDHVVLPGSSRPAPTGQSADELTTVKLWQKGFSINDGDLRPYDEPANQAFLQSIMRGDVPHELRQFAGRNFALEDHHTEEFMRPKAKPFSGKGHTLGSPAPTLIGENVVVGGSKVEETTGSNLADNEKRAAEQLNVNPNTPITTIQVRLSDGSRLSARFNLSHTINDVRQFIIIARPEYAIQPFTLCTTFPRADLKDNNQTIEAAGLQNAAILLRHM